MRYRSRLINRKARINQLRHGRTNTKSQPSKINLRFVVYASLVLFLLGFIKLYSYYYELASVPEPQTNKLQKINGTLEEGPLYFKLKESGLDEVETANIIAALEKVADPKTFNKKDKCYIALSSDGKFVKLVISHGIERYYVSKLKGDKYVSGEITLEVIETEKIAVGTIENSLWQSMTSNAITPQLVMEFSDVFAWNIDFLTELRQGDKYAIIWREKTTKAGDIVEQTILAAYYNGKETDTKKGFLWDNEYYDLNGGSMERMFLRAPLNFRRISSHFALRRFHPVLRIYRQHKGTDYVAQRGTPVSCVAKGKITYVGRKNQVGKHVQIKHDFGYTTTYGHLNEYAKKIKKGDKIKQGQIVGYVGSTGVATGPHLHFAIKQHGKYFNFIKFKNRASKGISKSKIVSFKQIADKLNEKVEVKLKETQIPKP